MGTTAVREVRTRGRDACRPIGSAALRPRLPMGGGKVRSKSRYIARRGRLTGGRRRGRLTGARRRGRLTGARRHRRQAGSGRTNEVLQRGPATSGGGEEVVERGRHLRHQAGSGRRGETLFDGGPPPPPPGRKWWKGVVCRRKEDVGILQIICRSRVFSGGHQQ